MRQHHTPESSRLLHRTSLTSLTLAIQELGYLGLYVDKMNVGFREVSALNQLTGQPQMLGNYQLIGHIEAKVTSHYKSKRSQHYQVGS